MTVYARRIKASPVRTASEVWEAIVALIAPQQESAARNELLAVAGVACSLISDEAAKTAPITVYGSGPRVRIYCLYDEDAQTGEDANETMLPFNATEKDWKLSLPCHEDDLAWVQSTLQKLSSRITARDVNATVDDETAESAAATKSLRVDKEAFFRS